MREADWSTAYETGIGAIDYEHRRLAETINATIASLHDGSPPEEILEGLGLLYERASAHCALESRISCHCAARVQPARESVHFSPLDNMAQMADAFYEGRCDACDRTLAACLQAWFAQHLQSAHGRVGGCAVAMNS